MTIITNTTMKRHHYPRFLWTNDCCVELSYLLGNRTVARNFFLRFFYYSLQKGPSSGSVCVWRTTITSAFLDIVLPAAICPFKPHYPIPAGWLATRRNLSIGQQFGTSLYEVSHFQFILSPPARSLSLWCIYIYILNASNFLLTYTFIAISISVLLLVI